MSIENENGNFAKPMLAAVKSTIDSLPIPKQNYTLIFTRKSWESEMFKSNGYSFSKEELDIAEKSQTKLIGNRNGLDCYLQGLFNGS